MSAATTFRYRPPPAFRPRVRYDQLDVAERQLVVDALVRLTQQLADGWDGRTYRHYSNVNAYLVGDSTPGWVRP